SRNSDESAATGHHPRSTSRDRRGTNSETAARVRAKLRTGEVGLVAPEVSKAGRRFRRPRPSRPKIRAEERTDGPRKHLYEQDLSGGQYAPAARRSSSRPGKIAPTATARSDADAWHQMCRRIGGVRWTPGG